MVVLSAKAKEFVDYVITATGFGAGLVTANLLAFPVEYQVTVGALASFATRSISHLKVFNDSGQAPSLAAIAGDVSTLTDTLMPQALEVVKKVVTDPTEQALVLGAIQQGQAKLKAVAASASTSTS